jgi:hypothetical protein
MKRYRTAYLRRRRIMALLCILAPLTLLYGCGHFTPAKPYPWGVWYHYAAEAAIGGHHSYSPPATYAKLAVPVQGPFADPSPVPEPWQYGLSAVGMLTIIFLRKRQSVKPS